MTNLESNPPPWLHDEADIVALLTTVVDRFDQQSGEARQRSIHIPAGRHLTTLSRGDEQADQVWSFVNELAARGVLAVRLGRRGPYDPQWQDARLSFSPAIEPTLRAWLGRPASPSQTALWRLAVEKHTYHFPVAGREMLLAKRIVIAGSTAEEVVAGLAKLGQVRRPATLRQLSTLAFSGKSKILDDRADLIAVLFPQLEVRERPVIVAGFLPQQVDAVLFIENQETYSEAIDGDPVASRNHALIYLAGFKGTALRIRTRQGARLHLAGPGRESSGDWFERWWFNEVASAYPVFFWGDLDFAGMQILKSLRQRFESVTAWQPGYEPMLADLRGAHPGGAANVEMTSRQVDPVMTGSDYADDVLLPAIRQYGFWDQERLSVG